MLTCFGKALSCVAYCRATLGGMGGGGGAQLRRKRKKKDHAEAVSDDKQYRWRGVSPICTQPVVPTARYA